MGGEGYGKQGNLGPEKVRGRWTVGNKIAAQEGGPAVNKMQLMASVCPGPILARSLSSGLESRNQALACPQLCGVYTNVSGVRPCHSFPCWDCKPTVGSPMQLDLAVPAIKTPVYIKSVRMYQMERMEQCLL